MYKYTSNEDFPQSKSHLVNVNLTLESNYTHHIQVDEEKCRPNPPFSLFYLAVYDLQHY